jgi:hypothetical protein
MATITKKSIDKAIAKFGMEIIAERGAGYSYFLDLRNGKKGYQVGQSVYVCYLNQMTLEEWVKTAEEARKDQDDKDEYIAIETRIWNERKFEII